MTSQDMISPAVIEQARAKALSANRRLTDVLEEDLVLAPAEFTRRLGMTLRWPVVVIEALYELTPAFELLSYHTAVQRNCFLVRDGTVLVCIVADPFDLSLQNFIDTIAPIVEYRVAHRADLAAYFAMHEETLRAIDSNAQSLPEEAISDDSVEKLSLASIAEDTSPVVKLVNSTIYDALKIGASDIHIETTHTGLQVKYRIDGVLASIIAVPGLAMAEQVVSRIKVMAELDIAERRIPQDGRFKLSVKGQEIDYRVSIMPSLVSEDVVIRVLDKRTLTDQVQGLRLDLLGFDPLSLAEIRMLANKPYGMLLVTGPTGSGKTTTMYAALSEINNGQDKIITIEDPVEYQLPGVLQIPVNEKKGLTFARGLRSILRHDPDKILVGEIRDPETAQIAVQSALTGHLVLTSVHANNVFDVLGRFLHMGVDTYSFVSALNGILAQRLLRLICTQCSTPYKPSAEDLAVSRISAEQAASMNFCRGKGCGHCRGSGYKGRHAIGEVLLLNDEMRELIVSRAPIRNIKEAARANGTRFLRDSALALMADGRTTLEEINRVTFVD
ncbi:GspE/PulE family protein [Duganella radicis]|uniref:Type II/IV secretion system protein n=1 Tax=Duganella radicis TaxID=551988 RepID=A0A6L6PQU3_9BURK|nr:GspE/PulE family protein [Duganella radicis]MTV40555.1 type II/IV secretion system protein [Duganella radicis]